MLTEIVRSCSNAYVAEAAIRSIGGRFAEDVHAAAKARGMSLGGYGARMVRVFDRKASTETRQALRVAIRRTDQPILAGLRFILDRAVEEEEECEGSACRSAAARRSEMNCLAALC